VKICENCKKYQDWYSRWKSKTGWGWLFWLAALAMVGIVILSGCQSAVTLYPLEGDHIINVAADEEFTAPRNGYFLSNEYFKKVLKAQVKEF
jgi:hypothetical protein